MASKTWLNRKQVKEKYGWGEKKLRSMVENRLITPAFDGRRWLYEEGSINVYLESISQKAKPPESLFESIRKEVKKDFQFLKGGATMSSKWKKSTAGRCRHQGHGFSLIEDKNGKVVHYYLDIRYPKRQTLSLGKISGRPIQDRSDALNVAYEFVTKRFTELEAASSPDTSFSQMIPIYEENLIKRKVRKAKEMIARIKAVLEPYFGKMKLREIRFIHIESYRDKRRSENVKDSSIQNELALARAMFNVARKKEKVNCQNPFEKVGVHLGLEVESRRRWMKYEEQERLWPELEKTPPLDDLATFELNLMGRPHNLIILRWKQVEWGDGEHPEVCRKKAKEEVPSTKIRIPKEHFKGKREVTFAINPVNLEILHRFYNQNPHGPDDFVFIRRNEKGELTPITRIWYQTEWKKACKRAGIEGLRFYDLKRTGGTRLVASGTTTAQLKDIMNHRHLSSTEHYTGDDIKACAKELAAKVVALNGVK